LYQIHFKNSRYGAERPSKDGSDILAVSASKSPANRVSLADLTNDHKVDCSDLAVFAQYWLDSGQYSPGDLSRNGLVSFTDFAIFAYNWLWEE